MLTEGLVHCASQSVSLLNVEVTINLDNTKYTVR